MSVRALPPLRRLLAAAATLVVTTAGLVAVTGPAAAVDPPEPLPAVGAGTTFLDGNAFVGGFDDPAWYRANIPFLEVPDRQIQDVYYYRWKTWKEHLVYTGPQFGWISSEFLDPVSYGAPYGGISAAAGHHINEGRWVRSDRYLDDYINYWLTGPGAGPKPAVEAVNPNTTDWGHEYSFWAASAVWNRYLINGDRAFVTAQQAALQRFYDRWNVQYNAALGLYWQVPVWDASELSAASYQSPDPYHGGAGYRPSINAYQYGDARAIAAIAALNGDTATAGTYQARAAALKTAMDNRLWDPQRDFYYHVMRDQNPGLSRLDTREHIGFVPWMFGMPDANRSVAWAQVTDPQGFYSAYGPTTAERRSPQFMRDALSGCCRWNGPSWPYATAQVLSGLANLLQDYPAQPYADSADYVDLLHRYALTQYRDGVPYVAEAHHPDENRWIYDGRGHSEDYNHSTYVDNVISGLIGVDGRADNAVTIKPLAPASWDYFLLENAPYHGHNLTVLWDRTGTRYGRGAGLRVFVDGAQVAAQAGLNPLTVTVGDPVTPPAAEGRVNIAANGQRHGNGAPQPFASYTFQVDNAWRIIDGNIFEHTVPQNTRWTSYSSPNATDHAGVDFGRPVTVDDVRLYFYDDGGGVRVPASYDLQYFTGAEWRTVPGQNRSPGGALPAANGLTRITFPAVAATRLRVVAPNRGGGVGWGISEFQVWSRPTFKIFNRHSGKLLAVHNASTANSAPVQQYSDTGTMDHRWELVDNGDGYFRIRNLNSGKVLGVAGMSTADSAQVVQYDDNGTADHLWLPVDAGDGNYRLVNRHSGKLLAVDRMSTADSADVQQFRDNGTHDQQWQLRPSVGR
ncbi:MGH1-like glycoside hydrolase domain-containing protein [Actinoplanes flavus]|uniref:RICIN domain-containing protein n=1 Tax=Actinoplanes flavus TaxID=2820290 RepID=A0ABS3UQS8_9ACTN|nr:RICIN domain-containing protein [Actinoplanes flavus]MBO3741133.1 RICIN domain-containing protein [Actinoplanes flavus]